VNRDVRSIDWLGATLGVIGMGNIGSQVAAAATGLGLRVIYSNRHKSEDTPYEYVSKEELYARSDVILLLTPLTEETRGMINKHSISQMKDGVIIVNVGESQSAAS
jgi:phosphoglycerate dehydrogenase-like enzyme